MNPTWTQMLFWIPAIVLSLAGIVAAALNFGRYPVPSTLVMVSCALSMVRAIAIPVLQGFVSGGSSLEDRMQWQTLITVFGTVTSSISFVLLLVAVYTGRRDSRNAFANQSPYGDSKPVMAEFASSDREPKR